MISFRVGICLVFIVTASSKPNATGWAPEQPTRSRQAFMPTFGETTPPIGHVNFCRANAESCRANTDALGRVLLTASRRSQLAGVNDRVNTLIKPATDLDLYGVVEHWTIPKRQGDCEDYVLLKRKLLMDLGWSSSTLLITVVRDERGDGHAVLTVRSTYGDLILDNKHSRILPWALTGYEFIKRQSHRDPEAWVSLTPYGGSTAKAVAAQDQR